MRTFLLLFALLNLTAALAKADVPAAPADLLGEEFDSPATGISFRPPLECVRGSDSLPGLIAEFNDDQRHWSFKVSRTTLEHPLPLTKYVDKNGDSHDGMLELSVAQLQQQPGAEIVTQDVVHVGQRGKIAVGTIVSRIGPELHRVLVQQGYVTANDQMYFLVELDSPARLDAAGEDPGERQAADTFNQVLDSIQFLDRAEFQRDHNERLLRTRGLFANWSADFLSSKMIPRQFFRLLRDGRDVGYTYEIDEYNDSDGRIGGSPVIRISLRSESEPAPGQSLESQARLTATVDRRHEVWESLAAITTPPAPDAGPNAKPVVRQDDETGMSDQSLKAAPIVPFGSALDVPPPGTDQPPDSAIQPGLKVRESWSLTVLRRVGRQVLPQFKRELPPWYLPQAMSYLLPRLVPFKEPRTYLFATYQPDGDNNRQAVMFRYLDVLPADHVDLDGQNVFAVPVKDHLGVEGPVTTHYLSPDDGSFLGSVVTVPGKTASDEPTTLMILPTDEATLKRLWPNCNLTQPDRIVDPVQGR